MIFAIIIQPEIDETQFGKQTAQWQHATQKLLEYYNNRFSCTANYKQKLRRWLLAKFNAELDVVGEYKPEPNMVE